MDYRKILAALGMTVMFCTLLHAETEARAIEYTPVKITFKNQSSYPVFIYVYLSDSLIKTHYLAKEKTFDFNAEHGCVVHIEYQPQPQKTILTPVDSLQEKSRVIVFVDDGRHVKIKETVSYKDHVKIERKKKKEPREKKKKDDNGDDSGTPR